MTQAVELFHCGSWQSNYIVLAKNNQQCLLTRHSIDNCGRSNLSQPFIKEVSKTRPQENIKLKGFFTTIEQLVNYQIKSWPTDIQKIVAEFGKAQKQENGLSKIAMAQLEKQPQKKLMKPTNTLIQINDICYVAGWKGRYRVIYNTNDFALVEGIEPLCECAGWSITPNYGSGLARNFKHYIHPQQLIKI